MPNRGTVEEFWGLAELDALAPVLSGGEQEFLAAFSRFLNSKGRTFWFASGREALAAALRALPKVANRDKVLIASFNCEVVADAAISARYAVKTFDFDDNFGAINWDRIAAEDMSSDVRAIIIPHLFGVPRDIRKIAAIARAWGICLIEDCAHTLGGKIAGETAGSIGDCAIYSFNFDKPISLGGGGVLVVNNDEIRIASPVPQAQESVAQERQMLVEFLETMYRWRDSISRVPDAPPPSPGLLARALNRLVKSVKPQAPSTQVGQLKFHGLGTLRAALGIYQIGRYAEVTALRNRNAQVFMGIPQWASWPVEEHVAPAWLRQKMVPKEPLDTQALALKLQRKGLRVGSFNWGRTVDCYLGMKEQPNSAYVARFGLDIPIHQNMEMSELEFIADTLAQAGGAHA